MIFECEEIESKCKGCDCYDSQADDGEFWTVLDIETKLCKECFKEEERALWEDSEPMMQRLGLSERDFFF